MVGSSKILTVSYGTFSCTLEGFDESFETMKAIAEYFRDLAADDRYFGAEPPTPDADMLARIAEREIARRVEAHEHEGRIVLRAQDNTTTGKALAAALGTAPETPPASKETPPDPKETPPAPEAEAAPEEAPEPEADGAVEATRTSDAATAAEVEATPEAESAVEDAPATEMDAAPPPVDEAGAPDMADAPDARDGTEDAAALAAPEPEGFEREEGEAASEDAAPPLLQQADEAAPPAPVAGADDLSARLDLIRSVVGASDSYDEDEHAQDYAKAAGPRPIAWEEADAGEDDAATPAAETTEATPPEAEDAAEAPAGQDDDDHAAPAAAEDSVFEDTLAALLADATPVYAQATEAPETAEAPEAPEAPEPDSTEAADATAGDDDDRRGARVVKVSRTDVDAARAEGLLDTVGAAGEDTVNIFGDETDALSPEDEADLQRELASLDAELGDGIGAEADAAEQEDAPEDTAERSAPAPEQAPAAAEPGKRTEVSRIFEETDSQMADPGSVRRRNTIQHLRAALAATRAEKAAGTDLDKKVDATPYRGDLDATVRPRRAIPAPDSPRSTRPEESRPAPLKLVAEQRVDTPRPKVRPRRVAAARAEVADAQDKGFSTFAEELGATDLPDLLEAAAAYLADVEGRSQFSRPMLMGKLREIDEEGFSREDGLRSFGQLLRQGKLQKLSGGRFAVTEETDFRAAAQRRAG
ncbi:MAG TPA: hypothetical protein VJ886_06830 [Roseovarius sp.]|nr:hypothetical protein [Roseovarius sp.]